MKAITAVKATDLAFKLLNHSSENDSVQHTQSHPPISSLQGAHIIIEFFFFYLVRELCEHQGVEKKNRTQRSHSR